MAIALEFDLINDPSLTKPFMARIDISIEPANDADRLAILSDPSRMAKARSIEGMFQSTSIASPRSGIQDRPLTEMRMNMWKRARQEATDAGQGGHPVGLVEFGNITAQSLTCPMRMEMGHSPKSR